ncbi:TlyA family RNA methyltransferase [Spelaeicoccus albus]|uniref:23S rRNA (Cytidine1920-2'-O)/16S rRNA (Cytidine1409-2'-O)-methyltransferase n=1 Tax=Spelaeicoccus albus TaxID=1280376 RepID=A0A7Z0IJ63_9MICO|nr:TlyA family RNA methyltransferase [Spelaeicoccus albus]NYI69097.1 23S rRNA (cytidine1920-2'-O)/16S rRNA (cytidine1409-2'-O)-methyltransferase [Spelaeicoccus albus]
MTERLDVELNRRGLARSRTHAAKLIADGAVTAAGRVARKPSTPVDADTTITVESSDNYVSRAAHKLAGALDDFGIDHLAGRVLDAGASTGGFTQVALERGADAVIAVDVGHGQLAPSLEADGRVTSLEGKNVRTLAPRDIGGPVDTVVGDLSFISLTLALPALIACSTPGASLFLMVKPQFELTRADLDGHGVVRDPSARARAVRSVAAAANARGLVVRAAARSKLPGPSGNNEYFLWLTFSSEPAASMFDLDEFLESVEGVR